MYKIIKTYVPSIAMSFTLVILYSCIYNMIFCPDARGYCAFVVELFLFLVVTTGIDLLISKIEFKTYIGYYLAEALIIYPIMLLTGFVGRWFTLNIGDIVNNSIAYFIIMGLVHYYYYYIKEKQAEEINQSLKKYRKE